MLFEVLITDMMVIYGANENESIRLGRVRLGKVMMPCMKQRLNLHLKRSSLEVTAPAGTFCSSTAAELVAIHTGLDTVLALPAENLDQGKQINLYIDSESSLLRLSRSCCLQSSSHHLEVWDRLNRLAGLGLPTTLQWVPGHVRVEGNEAADTRQPSGGD